MTRIFCCSIRYGFAVLFAAGFAGVVPGIVLASTPPAALPDTPPATQPATAPVVVDAKDREKLLAAIGHSVVVEGTVKEANWSPSGKVLRIALDGTKESHFLIIIFQPLREKFDKAYNGDVAKALTGASIRVLGKLAVYKENPEIVVGEEAQLTVTQPAPVKPE